MYHGFLSPHSFLLFPKNHSAFSYNGIRVDESVTDRLGQNSYCSQLSSINVLNLLSAVRLWVASTFPLASRMTNSPVFRCVVLTLARAVRLPYTYYHDFHR